MVKEEKNMMSEPYVDNRGRVELKSELKYSSHSSSELKYSSAPTKAPYLIL